MNWKCQGCGEATEVDDMLLCDFCRMELDDDEDY